MKLTCKVVSVHDGGEFTDDLQRIDIAVREGSHAYKTFRIVNHYGLALGDCFTLVMVKQPEPTMAQAF